MREEEGGEREGEASTKLWGSHPEFKSLYEDMD